MEEVTWYTKRRGGEGEERRRGGGRGIRKRREREKGDIYRFTTHIGSCAYKYDWSAWAMILDLWIPLLLLLEERKGAGEKRKE